MGRAIGLAIASAIAILIYVGLLGWLQRRRFSREAAIRGDRLDRVGGFLRASLCMAFATGVAHHRGIGNTSFASARDPKHGFFYRPHAKPNPVWDWTWHLCFDCPTIGKRRIRGG
jgi:hypothetical protein